MMAVGGVAGSNNPGYSPSLAGNGAGVADNFQSFLSILTTQLQNQNPLDPMDTNAFTQQLVQFSQVEQQLKTNSFLEALLNVSSSNQSSSNQAMSLIGKEVTVNSAASELKDGKANWIFQASSKADDATVTVKDTKGNVVYETKMPAKAGENRFVWDGKASNGTTAPDGPYSIAITGNDVLGTPVNFNAQMVGQVEGIDLTGAEPFLIVGAARISLASVLSIRDQGVAKPAS
jgi:flagellar basal-body rod modification protein FlgD